MVKVKLTEADPVLETLFALLEPDNADPGVAAKGKARRRSDGAKGAHKGTPSSAWPIKKRQLKLLYPKPPVVVKLNP